MCEFRGNMREKYVQKWTVGWKMLALDDKLLHSPYFSSKNDSWSTKVKRASRKPTKSNEHGFYIYTTRRGAFAHKQSEGFPGDAIVKVLYRGHCVFGSSLLGAGVRAEYAKLEGA